MRSKHCLKPDQDGKGFWIQDDKTFGFGLNIPRTRHVSEVLKTTVKPTTALHFDRVHSIT